MSVAPACYLNHVLIQTDWGTLYVHFVPGVHLSSVNLADRTSHFMLNDVGILLVIWIEAVADPVHSNQQNFLPVESLVDEVDHFFLGYHLVSIVV